MKDRVAFTLPQLLVSIAIGSLLIVTLLPTLQSDRENLRRAVCANNLRQIGQAMIMYSDDFHGSFPTAAPLNDESGVSLLKREVGIACSGCNPAPRNNAGGFTAFARYLVKHHYVGSPVVFVCPSDTTTGSTIPHTVYTASTWQEINWYNLSYFYVVKMTTQWPTKSGPATTNRCYMLCADRANQSSFATPDLTSADNHGTDGRNVLFTDSHVEWKSSVSVSDLIAPIQTDWGSYGPDPPTTSPQVLGQQDGI
jgi:type II secretory pathway pseudopilin PulG